MLLSVCLSVCLSCIRFESILCDDFAGISLKLLEFACYSLDSKYCYLDNIFNWSVLRPCVIALSHKYTNNRWSFNGWYWIIYRSLQRLSCLFWASAVFNSPSRWRALWTVAAPLMFCYNDIIRKVYAVWYFRVFLIQ